MTSLNSPGPSPCPPTRAVSEPSAEKSSTSPEPVLASARPPFPSTRASPTQNSSTPSSRVEKTRFASRTGSDSSSTRPRAMFVMPAESETSTAFGG